MGFVCPNVYSVECTRNDVYIQWLLPRPDFLRKAANVLIVRLVSIEINYMLDARIWYLCQVTSIVQ